MRERDWNRRSRKRQARYTHVPDAMSQQLAGLHPDGASPENEVRARARNRALKNVGPLEQRSARRRLALAEANQEI